MNARVNWMELLPMNQRGRKALTFAAARQVVEVDPSGWYVVPFNVGWTVGKATGNTDKDRYFHVVKQDGEPLFFDSVDAAKSFLRLELKILRAPVLKCAGD